jgi:hypothetical protein
MKKWIFFAGIALFILSSCSIQKRNYQTGYYISWKKNPATAHKVQRDSKLPEIDVKEPALPAELIASSLTQKENPEQQPVPVYTGTKTYIDNCDTLFFRNGMVVKAKVAEIGITEVKYRYCNNPDGPILVARKDDIASVTYSNGDKDFFTVAPNPRREAGWKKQDEVQRAKGMASDSFILGVFSIPGLFVYGSGIIAAFLAIRRGNNALAVLERNPQENAAIIRRAKAGILLGKVALGIVISLITLLIVIAYHII